MTFSLYNSLKRGCSELEVCLFCHVLSERMRGNDHNFFHEMFRLDIRKRKKITERVVRHWNKLSREVVESVSLELIKRHLDVALEDLV